MAATMLLGERRPCLGDRAGRRARGGPPKRAPPPPRGMTKRADAASWCPGRDRSVTLRRRAIKGGIQLSSRSRPVAPCRRARRRARSPTPHGRGASQVHGSRPWAASSRSPRARADALYGFSIEFPVRPAARRPASTYVSLVGMAVLVVSAEPAAARRVEPAARLADSRSGGQREHGPRAAGKARAGGAPAPLVILSNGSRCRTVSCSPPHQNDERLRDTL